MDKLQEELIREVHVFEFGFDLPKQ